MPLADLFLPYVWGEGASRAFAEWQRETTLPESGLQSKGWARLKVGLRVLSVSKHEKNSKRIKGAGQASFDCYATGPIQPTFDPS